MNFAMTNFEPQVLLVLTIFAPLLTAAAIYATGQFERVRNCISFLGALASCALVLKQYQLFMADSAKPAEISEIFPHLSLAFEVTGFGLVFALLASILWLVTLIYAHGYMHVNKYSHKTGFYAFFAITIACALGIAFSANLLTMFIFYEIMTFSTYPLVIHSGNEQAKKAARIYIGWLVGASVALFLPAMIYVYQLTGTTDFTAGGLLVANEISGNVAGILALIFAFAIAKAALMPVQGWLPAAMVAPTPVSALLHAVAVVKAGVFCLAKITFFIIGAEAFTGTNPMLFIALFSMLAASIIALRKDNLKQRLAYSTIAQLAYVGVATALLAPISLAAAALHMVAHGVAKILLFFCAGAIASTTGKKYVNEFDGLGKNLPLICGAFFVASLSMIGVPYIAGGVSKEYILLAADNVGMGWIAWFFYVSMALNAAYYLPISWRFFAKQGKIKIAQELPKTMTFAIVFCALLTLGFAGYSNFILDLVEIYE